MAIPLQLRRGTTEQHTTFTGAVGEVTVDTDKDTLIVHDGTTAGGFQVAKTTKTSTDNAIARFDGTTGAIQNSSVVVDDNGNVGMGVPPTTQLEVAIADGASTQGIRIKNLDASMVAGQTVGALEIYSSDPSGAGVGVKGAIRVKSNDSVGSAYDMVFTTSNATSNDVERMRIDANGNCGWGVTPSAWTSPAMEFTQNIALSGILAGVSRNAYFDSASRYKTNGASGLIQIGSNGSMSFLQAPIGTAGNAITWTTALTIPNTGGIQLPNTAIANATTLDWYEEATATLTATGMTTSPTGTGIFTRKGDTVTLTVPSITGTSNSNTFTLTGVPINFRPSTFRNCILKLVDNGTAFIGIATIGTDGIITMGTASGASFTTSGVKGVTTVSCSYHI